MNTRLLIGIGLMLGLGSGAHARDVASIEVTSPAFKNGGAIPVDYTCQGKGVSPQLDWSGIPPETQSIAVIIDDPDAPGGTFDHLVTFNLPPSTRSLPHQVQGGQTTLGLQALNSRGQLGFAPICPPSGEHHYRFVVMALDRKLPLAVAATGKDVERAAQGHILGRGELTGTFGH
jgi:Raf kinase inhibitor-like YbhB/YbcL family protein